MRMQSRKTRNRRARTTDGVHRLRTRPDAQARSPSRDLGAATAPTDAAWRAIVEQLLATPSDTRPYEPDERK
jgi:hypothetical protein